LGSRLPVCRKPLLIIPNILFVDPAWPGLTSWKECGRKKKENGIVMITNGK